MDRTYVLWRRRRLSYFGGCDYFRLSSHPNVLSAVASGLAEYGLNVAASRKTTGNHRLFEQLESELARFFGADSASLVSNGYLTNLVAAQALRGRISHALIDERSHCSLREAATFLECRLIPFRHRDFEDMERRLARLKNVRRVAVLTDGLFSHDGSSAPLREYRRILGPRHLLWIDDAHAGGVLGASGRGSIEEAGLSRRNTVQTVTLSKAFGVYGGAVLGERSVRRAIAGISHAFAGNTPLPLPLAAGALASVRFLRANPSLRGRLRGNIAHFWSKIGAAPTHPDSPIIGFAPVNPNPLKRALLRAGIYPSHIRYPGGPPGGYFRFALSSEHDRAQIEALASVLRAVPERFALAKPVNCG